MSGRHMRVFLSVLLGSFVGVLGALSADRWLVAAGWVSVPPAVHPVVRRFSPDDVEITVRPVEPRALPSSSVDHSGRRRQYPQGEIYWSDSPRK